MAIRRLPKHLSGIESKTEGELLFDDRVDIRGGDTIVFDDGVIATVNGVTLRNGHGTRVILGKDPSCAPRKHSGKAPPKFEADGVTPFGGGE